MIWSAFEADIPRTYLTKSSIIAHTEASNLQCIQDYKVTTILIKDFSNLKMCSNPRSIINRFIHQELRRGMMRTPLARTKVPPIYNRSQCEKLYSTSPYYMSDDNPRKCFVSGEYFNFDAWDKLEEGRVGKGMGSGRKEEKIAIECPICILLLS